MQVELWPHQGGYAKRTLKLSPAHFEGNIKLSFVFYASLTGFKHVESFLFHMISMSSHEWTCFSQISMSYQECTTAAMVIMITICVKLFSCQFHAFTFILIGFCFCFFVFFFFFFVQIFALQTTIKQISREHKGTSFMDI